MAMGCIINSLWDAWAKIEEKPMWKLLVDLEPEKVIDSIDWRYLEDALPKSEALKILKERFCCNENFAPASAANC